MAGEIQYLHNATGASLYVTIRTAAGTMWNGSAFEARTVANWGNYDIALTETPASGLLYVGTFPAGVTAGWYWLDVYVGASPAITDPAPATMHGYWDGTTYHLDGWQFATEQF
jgi:hypothetical protein